MFEFGRGICNEFYNMFKIELKCSVLNWNIRATLRISQAIYALLIYRRKRQNYDDEAV